MGGFGAPNDLARAEATSGPGYNRVCFPMRVARRYLISGCVHGVGFRYFAQTAASSHGIDGWVRNLPDGRVEIAAVGDEDPLSQFESQIKTGPRGAAVTNVEVTSGDATDIVGGHAPGFRIR